MQQVFAIPIKDEIQNDNKNDSVQDDQDENLDIIDTDIEESQNNGESNYDIDQLDKIFSSEKVS